MGTKGRFNIWTSGCQMNEHDSEIMRALLEKEGYQWTPQSETADIVILNTCSVRKTAEERALGFLGNMKHRKNKNPELVIAVGGCMTHNPQVREFLVKKAPFVNIIFGTRNFYKLPQFLEESLEHNQRIVAAENNEAGETPGLLPAHRESPVKGYVTIMYGCNNYCSYCIVPYARGREKSRPVEEIMEEVTRLAANGYREVMLLGQNVNSFGTDLPGGKVNFAGLLKSLDEIPGLARIRYMTSHPRDFTDELIATIAASQKICEHFHLPVQAGSNKILQLMNRGYTREKFVGLAERIREKVPQSSITTDIIVGFPQETEDDFQDTLDMVEEVRFDAAFTFLYSPRQGTAAVKMQEQVTREIKKERMARLVDLQNKITLEQNLLLENQVVEVLVEGKSKKNPQRWSGRTRTNKIVDFESIDDRDLTGKTIDVLITCAQTWNLLGILKKVHKKEESVPLTRI